MTNTVTERPPVENPLGIYLRDRRSKLDPTAFGLPVERRRTLGLRRDEVAQRANISLTWYTCLEQGRGGAPSADVLDRLARALMLTDVEREHLFLLGLGRPPKARYRGDEDVTPRLQHVLDALHPSPALILTAVGNVVAWNRAATVVLGDYASRSQDQRNVLRILFLDPRARAAQDDWESICRRLVGALRANAARAGAGAEIAPLVDELRQLSPEFRKIWDENDVHGVDGEAIKHIRHPVLGRLAFEFSIFAVDGRSDLYMTVYYPSTPTDAQRIMSLMEARSIDAQ
ncbi:helix-turn-helix transcriptional regulator [Aliidongia dinghuensis]|uniref:helix-turn-helix transcriptional regulator n=1 Tax=Aliidongia dinghuensis TaxID=1867774 RepID=UPI00166371E8|nr:helix-turn-helix transcriptional regulator [Aliidongia dinghuensis]